MLSTTNCHGCKPYPVSFPNALLCELRRRDLTIAALRRELSDIESEANDGT